MVVVQAGTQDRAEPARARSADHKGSVSGPIRIRENPIESAGGHCTRKMNTCEINLAREGSRTGPMLLRRVAAGMYEPLDVCTQGEPSPCGLSSVRSGVRLKRDDANCGLRHIDWG